MHALWPFELSLSTNWRGTRYGGWPTLGSWDISRTLFSPSGVVLVSELSPITLQPKKKKKKSIFPQWMVLYTAKLLLSPPALLSLDPLPCYSQCDICTLCYVDMCQCVCMCTYVCVYSSLQHVFLASGLALSPAPWLAYCPCDVHGVLSAGMKRPLCSPARERPVCVCWRLLLCGWSSLLVFVSLGPPCPPFKHRSDFSRELNYLYPSCFQGMFFWKRGRLLDCILQQLYDTRIDFFPPSSPFLTFFRHFS